MGYLNNMDCGVMEKVSENLKGRRRVCAREIRQEEFGKTREVVQWWPLLLMPIMLY